MMLAVGGETVTATGSFCLVALERVDSTNEEARRRARDGAASGTVVWAREQDAGRGRRGRRWESPAGNLYFSVILRPACPVAAAAQLSLVAAVAVAEALEGVVKGRARPQVKWPNDILLDGRKVAGILLEVETGPAVGAELSVAWLVVGVGVNVASFPKETAYPATALAEVIGSEVASDLRAVLEVCLERFADGLTVWQREGVGAVRTAWLARAAGLGQPITVRLHHETLSGRFGGLDLDGALLLESADEAPVRRITAGDVFFSLSSVTLDSSVSSF